MPHLRDEGEAGRGGIHPLTFPDEQTHPEAVLQGSDLLAYRSVGERQGVGRLGEAALAIATKSPAIQGARMESFI